MSEKASPARQLKNRTELGLNTADSVNIPAHSYRQLHCTRTKPETHGQRRYADKNN